MEKESSMTKTEESKMKYNFYPRLIQFLDGSRIELVEWKRDLLKLWDLVMYFTKEAFSKRIYIITAVNGSCILEQRVVTSYSKLNKQLEHMNQKWHERNVHFECKRIS